MRVASSSARATTACLVVIGLTLAALQAAPARAERKPAPPTPERRSEVLAERSARTQTYRNADGSFTQVVHSRPVHYRRGGRWLPISSEVVPTEGGTFAWRNEANSFRTLFKDSLGDGHLRFVTPGGPSFSLDLTGASEAAAAPASGPSSSITYPGAFGGVDLRYDLIPDGVKETLVLRDAASPSQYGFTLQADDPQVEAVEQRDGSWAFFSPGDNAASLVLHAPVAFDSAGADAGDGAAMTVEGRDGDFVVDVSLDPRWLSDPDREFPVFLDPTMTVQPTAMDATFPAGCANCTPLVHSVLHVGTSATQPYRAGLYFDLGDPPTMSEVTSAQLVLARTQVCFGANEPNDYIPPDAQNACPRVTHALDVHRMTSAWSTTSPSSAIAFDPVPLSTFVFDTNTRERPQPVWDVTATARAWIAGTQPNFGLLLKRKTEELGAGGPNFPSRTHPNVTGAPALHINYVGDAVTLDVPDTLHSDGADLTWTRYSGSAPFQAYQVHRSATAGFTPSAATLLATLNDIDQTAFRDTTAAAGKTFSYKIATGGSASNGQRVALPPDGHATKLLQPDATAGKMAGIWANADGEGCNAVGPGPWVGTWLGSKHRALLEFDLGDIPADATVGSATLSLWQKGTVREPMTVDVHQATRAWGAGTTACRTTWTLASEGVAWTAPGGDLDASPVASKDLAPAQEPSWNSFDLTSLARRWATGEAPNLGLILKKRDEAPSSDSYVQYASDEDASPAVRPKLLVQYVDGSHARGPAVEISSPAEGAGVSGARTIAVAASDDRRVDKVEVFRNGVSLGVDTSAPYEVAWATTSTSNGAHVLTAKATDDAGNETTSRAVTVNVQNSNPPTVGLTAPLAAATVKGTVAVSATASDDVTLDRVEFFFDGNRIGAADTAAPYTVSWNTLDAAQPAFDGTHELTARAYDNHGQMTISAARSVTVANTTSTKYRTTWTSSAVPQAMPYDPALAAASQQNQPVDVTVTNKSTVAWSATDVVLRYRWLRADGSVAATGTDVALPASLAAGASRLLRVNVKPPALPDGVDKAQFLLRMDMFEKSTSSFFSAKGNKPLDNPVIVNKVLKATALGLERYYHYDGQPLGAGMSQLTNVANGNSLLHWTPFASPGRGLATVVDLTYNSLEDKSESPVGNNFSLSISSLSRLGLPLDVHPNKADELAGRATKYIEFTDGDGTTHRFTQNAAGGWDEPPGVHLYLRQFSTTDLTRKWAITRPDRTTFFYDDGGFPTSVQDRNGNTITFAYEAIPAGDDPGGVKKRVTTITDAAGQGSAPAPNRTFTIDYYSKNEAKKPQVRGKVESIKDHNGSALVFDYYEDGNLLRLTQKGGTRADGSPLADRSFVFTYTTSAGDGPAIAAETARVNPDPKTANQSTRIYSVRDPRGTETTFAYYGSTSGQDRWKLRTRTDRAGSATTYAYDNAATMTTITAPLSRVWKYDYDSAGMISSIVDPLNRTTGITWSGDRHVTKVTEPGGAYTEFAYNANGYLTDRWDQLRNHLFLGYENLAVDANDVSTRWKSGRQIPHISQLRTKVDARGNSWTYGYDTKGNLTTVTEPEGTPAFQTIYAYNPDGTVASVTDANRNVTQYQAYDANGMPARVVDAAGGVSTFGYDDDGLLRWVQDPNHASYSGGNARTYRSYFDYDSFHRLGRQSFPKMTSENAPLIWTAAEHDPNDNVVKQWSAEEGHEFTRGDVSTASFDRMDRVASSTNPDSETTSISYDPAGAVQLVTLPKGQAIPGNDDHSTSMRYDALGRLRRQSRYETDSAGAITKSFHTHFCYDGKGNLKWVTRPRAGLDTVDCDATTPPSHTTRHEYDDAHRLRAVVDPLGHRTERTYDPNGNVETATDAEGVTVTRSYDRRNLLTKVVQPLITGTGGRDAVTKIEYDGVGLPSRVVSPRGWDASTDKQTFRHYVTTYAYDALNRVETVTLPTDARDAAPYYVHRDYDANGNVRWTSLPTTAATPEAVAGDKKTTLTYFDTGWVKTSHDAGNYLQNPTISYDYWPEGWQRSRTPDGGSTEVWTYDPDGMLREHLDRKGQKVLYDYDDHNMLVTAKDRSGLVDPTQQSVEIAVLYDGLDRVRRTQHRREGSQDWSFSTFSYDLDSNLVERNVDGIDGAVPREPRRVTFTYDEAGWLDVQTDYGDGAVPADDVTTDNAYTNAGREKERIFKRADGTPRQTTQWTYFANGALKTLVTRGGGPTAPVVERHTVGYFDENGIYVNGNRTSDAFLRTSPDAGAPCRATECVERFVYDAREKLVAYRDGRAGEITYQIDPTGNVDVEKRFAGGVLQRTTDYDYTGNRLTGISVDGAASARYLYDTEGNLDCVVRPAFTGATCPAPGADLTSDYSYDYLNRLLAYKSYLPDGAVDDDASYVYDALDRIVDQRESHGATAPRTTQLSYVGLTSLASLEKQFSGGNLVTQKAYAYDAYGHRTAMTNTPANAQAGGKAGTFTYGYDAHGSVSMLLDGGGTPVASYGYAPYGGADDALTKEPLEGGTSADDPLNPYRYTAKRLDTGSGTVDMGARRFGPGIGRFLQQDQFASVAADVNLTTDPLTQNRYSLAAGNPVSFVEWDGHMPIETPEGGAVPAQEPVSAEPVSTLGHRLAQEGMHGEVAPPPPPDVAPRNSLTAGGGLARDMLTTVERGGPVDPTTKGFREARELLLGPNGTGPRMLPTTWGYAPCEDLPNGSVEDYLTGRACPPPGFPYNPIVKMTHAGPRALDPQNDGCSAVPEKGDVFDFTDACLMHDYGYDLLRHGVKSFHRYEVDKEMDDAMFAYCKEVDQGFFMDDAGCYAVDATYSIGLIAWTTIEGTMGQGDATPSGSIDVFPTDKTVVTWE